MSKLKNILKMEAECFSELLIPNIKLCSVTAKKSQIFNPPTPDVKGNMERTQGK
jgi:hypothetical protein